ncbi:hypothetical protein JDV02_006578 [Purpureocillium takamizusanense]|uniref:Uncharacterized protein n=1 Tax=Purpureocillium takamizusanense TaxID=2060973 RepID=A0A9Q8QIL3_9HYPO|nr:uncharacterized protein JDV02_006578 [Purpureocillium takamizusanense]UNI20498.1 hypothetical protein JDV02_006578 [Purpureocillium takamizusanense]
MGDMIDRDAPQLGFKFMTYTDVTLFATTFSHCTWDISGIIGFMKALELVLDGRDDEVPTLLGARTDILAEIASQHKSHNQDDLLLKMVSQKKVERSERRLPPLEERIIRVPFEILQRLQKRLVDEDANGDQETWTTYQPDELFLAFIVQQVARAVPEPHPLNLLNILNARLVVPSLAKAKGIYMQNLVLVAPNRLSPEVSSGPLWRTALSQRHCLAESTTPENIARSLSTVLGAIEADVDTTAIASAGDALPLLINNLNRFTNDLDVDFSSAVVRQGDTSEARRNAIGTADFCYLSIPNNPFDMMRMTMLGSYNGDACWMFGELPGRAWELLQVTLDEL